MVFSHSNRLFLGFCFSSDVLSETAPTSEMYQLPIHTEISSMEYLGFQIDQGAQVLSTVCPACSVITLYALQDISRSCS